MRNVDQATVSHLHTAANQNKSVFKFYPVKPTGKGRPTYVLQKHTNLCILPFMYLFYVLCTSLKINSHYFPVQHSVGELDNGHGYMFVVKNFIYNVDEKIVRHILYPVDGGSMSLRNVRTYVYKMPIK
jgi:hypothetical protein